MIFLFNLNCPCSPCYINLPGGAGGLASLTFLLTSGIRFSTPALALLSCSALASIPPMITQAHMVSVM